MTNKKIYPQVINIPSSGEELYDSIMAKIEPALTTEQLPHLKEKLRKKSVADQKSMAKQLVTAFKTFKDALKKRQQELTYEVDGFSRNSKEIAEGLSKMIDDDKLDTLAQEYFI